MSKAKTLPSVIHEAFARASLPTISITRPVPEIELRRSDSQFLAHIVSRNGFCTDYFDNNRAGSLIIKSDLNRVFEHNGRKYYRSVNKNEYAHHHIETTNGQESRVNSILACEFRD